MEENEMTKREDVKPGKNLKMAAGLVASAAAATVAAMAYKVNEEKINAGVDKAADFTKKAISKVSEKVKEVADDIMDMTDVEKAAPEEAEPVVVDVEETECSRGGADAQEAEACSCGCEEVKAAEENIEA
jgi:hypothetical protein